MDDLSSLSNPIVEDHSDQTLNLIELSRDCKLSRADNLYQMQTANYQIQTDIAMLSLEQADEDLRSDEAETVLVKHSSNNIVVGNPESPS